MCPLVLAVICGRANSKGLVNKNLYLLNGYEMLAYNLWAVEKAKTITHYCVSTDSVALMATAQDFKAKVIIRPIEYCLDDSPIEQALIHAVTSMEMLYHQYDIIVCLQNSNPIRFPYIIDQCVNTLWENHDFNSVLTIHEVEHEHPDLCYSIDQGKLIPKVIKTHLRQKRDKIYAFNGVAYAICRDYLANLMSIGRIINDKMGGVIVPYHQSFDIHSKEDILIVEAMLDHYGITREVGYYAKKKGIEKVK